MVGLHDPQYEHETWSSETVFLLATIGGAVGLGNLWRFPFHAGQNGGGAFVLVYVGFVFLLCLPLVATELALGRRGKASPVTTIRKLNSEAGGSSFWNVFGWISIGLPLLALGYYAVIAGWSIDYMYKAAMNSFKGIGGEESAAAFTGLVTSPTKVLAYHAAFIAGAVFVVARGIGKGIEVLMRYMMPALLLMLIGLALYSVFTADIAAGLSFLFKPDFSKITWEVALMALGQAFFSIAVGVGMMLTYGAYLPQEVRLGRAAVVVVAADTAVALLAGIVIFPIVFSNGLDPAEGPGLVFITLPIAFGSMTGGYIVGLAFFVMLFFAAFSTVIAMLEPAVSWLEEHRGISRAKVTVMAGAAAWLVGLSAALSFNVLSDVRLITSIPMMADKTIFDLVDFVVGTVGIPLNAALMSLFAGWVISRNVLLEEMGISNPVIAGYVMFIIRYVSPIVIGAILVTNLLPA